MKLKSELNLALLGDIGVIQHLKFVTQKKERSVTMMLSRRALAPVNRSHDI